MRRSGHPSRPRASTCCFLASFKTLLISTKATCLTPKSTSPASFSLAGFQGTLIGRFWVTPEVINEQARKRRIRMSRNSLLLSQGQDAHFVFGGIATPLRSVVVWRSEGTHARPMLKHCTCNPQVTSVNAWLRQFVHATIPREFFSYQNFHPLRKTISQWGAPLCIHLVWVTSMFSLNRFATPLAMPIASAHSLRGEP